MDDTAAPARPKLSDLIREHEITITFVHGAEYNADFKDSNPWTVTLHRPGAPDYTVPFYMGPGLVDPVKKTTVWVDHVVERRPVPAEPDVERVLDCQLSDACTVESAESFGDWCRDLGFSETIKARKMYQTCMENALRLRKLLGEHYETFLYADRD